jgi:hypothetical protein
VAAAGPRRSWRPDPATEAGSSGPRTGRTADARRRRLRRLRRTAGTTHRRSTGHVTNPVSASATRIAVVVSSPPLPDDSPGGAATFVGGPAVTTAVALRYGVSAGGLGTEPSRSGYFFHSPSADGALLLAAATAGTGASA